MKRTLNFPSILQSDIMECGTTCLAIIFRYFGYYDIRNFLTQYAQVDTEGVDLYTLSEIAEGFGFETSGYQIQFENFSKIHMPCIAHYEGNHFVVVYKTSKTKVWISDPASGKYTVSKDEFTAKWNGVVLELRPGNEVFRHNELTSLAEEWRENRKKIWKAFYRASFIGTSKYLKWIVFSTLTLLGLSLMLPFFTQAIIDHVIASRNMRLLYAILGSMTVIFIIQVLLSYYRNLFLTQFKIEYERNFFSKFFKHTILLPQTYYDRHKSEDFINRFSEHLKIRDYFNPSLLEELIEVLFIPAYLAILFLFNVTLGLIVLGCIILIIITLRFSTPKLMRLENYSFEEKSKTLGLLLDAINGIQTVKLLNLEKIAFWKWKNAYTKSLNKVLNTEKAQVDLNIFTSAISLVTQALVYWYGAYLAFEGEITLGTYIAFITIFSMLLSSVMDLRQLWMMGSELAVSINKVNDILSEPIINKNIRSRARPVGYAIQISKLCFAYNDRQENWTLDSLNMKIPTGQFVGIIGRNGSGKSTLAKLLAGLYEPDEGRISIGGVPIKELSTQMLKKSISIIPQEIYIFDGTIRENILYGNPNADEKQLIKAVNLSGLAGFVRSNFLGLNFKVGESGGNLSGGLRIRVAFARLFLNSPKIIIMDEASSALDPESEKLLLDNVKKAFPKSTILSIAHRVHTLKKADQIIVLDRGRLIEFGHHNELIKKRGVYHQFLNTYVD